MIHFMLLSDFEITMKGKLDDVDSDVLGRLVLNVSVGYSGCLSWSVMCLAPTLDIGCL